MTKLKTVLYAGPLLVIALTAMYWDGTDAVGWRGLALCVGVTALAALLDWMTNKKRPASGHKKHDTYSIPAAAKKVKGVPMALLQDLKREQAAVSMALAQLGRCEDAEQRERLRNQAEYHQRKIKEAVDRAIAEINA